MPKLYSAIIWVDDQKPGERVSVEAENLADAKSILEDKHGKGTVYDLHNEEDADRPR